MSKQVNMKMGPNFPREYFDLRKQKAPYDVENIKLGILYFSNFFGTTAPQWARASSFMRFKGHIQSHHTR